jgi:hypothetical protein
MFDLLRTAMVGLSELLLRADVWPILVLAAAFGLLLLQLTVLTVVVSSQTRRLGQLGRHVRDLSRVVQRQAQTIEHFVHSGDDLAPAPGISLPAEGAEKQIPDMRESLSDREPGHEDEDFEEQFRALREVMLAETSKKD